MTTTITPDDTNYPAIVAPSAGEGGVASSIQSLAQNLGDRQAYINAGELLNWEQALGSDTTSEAQRGQFEKVAAGANIDLRGGDVDPISGIWVIAGNTDGCNTSHDDGRTFQPFGGGMSGSHILSDCAIGATSSAVCVGVATWYRRDSILTGTWSTLSAPGSPTFTASIVYDTSNSRHIVVGNESSTEPYVATGNNATGTAFTDRSAAVPSGFNSLGLASLAVDTSGKVVACTKLAHTKIAYSADGGVTWSESTTSLTSGIYNVAWSVDLALFVAFNTASTSNNYVYTSPTGNVWTSRFTGSMGFDATANRDYHGIACYGRAFVTAGDSEGANLVAVSFDIGVTWASLRVSDTGSGGNGRLVSSRTNGKLLHFDDNSYGARSVRRILG